MAVMNKAKMYVQLTDGIILVLNRDKYNLIIT